MIELDVRLTRDGHLVAFHDPELERTTDGKGPVREHTLAELKRLDAGAWFHARFRGEEILTLEEVVQLVGRRAILNVEVKSAPSEWRATALRTAAVLAHAGILGTTVISCFELGALRKVREVVPAARLGILWQREEWEEAWKWSRELAAWSLHPWFPLVSEAVVRQAHARGMRVFPWTVNEPGDIARLADLGVDGIITDFPERVSKAVRARAAAKAVGFLTRQKLRG